MSNTIKISATIRQCADIDELKPRMRVAVLDDNGDLKDNVGFKYITGTITRIYADEIYLNNGFYYDFTEIFIIENI